MNFNFPGMNFSLVNELILAVVLGVTQGITEFLPISSTAHIRLITDFLTKGRDIGLITSNVIQLGTTIALIQVFFPEIKKYYTRLVQIISNQENWSQFWNHVRFWQNYSTESTRINNIQTFNEKYQLQTNNEILKTDIELMKITIGTLPIIILGFTLSSFVGTSEVRSLQAIAGFLLAGSVLMFTAERIHNQAKILPKPFFWSIGESLMVGLFQFLAIFPGISRSGSTISGSLFLGRNRSESVRFSFLLAIPTILLAGIYDLFKLILGLIGNKNLALLPNANSWTANTINLSVASLAISLFTAYIFGLISLKWLLKFLSKNTFTPFVIYRVILAIALLFLFYFVK